MSIWLVGTTWSVSAMVALKCTLTALSSRGQSMGNSPTPSLMRRLVTSPLPVRSRTYARCYCV